MASVVDILARLRADSSQFVAEMAKAGYAAQSLDKTASKTSGILGTKLKLGFLAATTAATLFAVKLGRDSVQAAQSSGAAQNRLRRLLLNTNGATEEGIAILNQHAKALERSTGVSKQNITTVQSQLATFDLHGGTIAKLTPAILDYVVAEKGANASASEYRQMTNGLAQALNGQFASLTATGFVLSDYDKKMVKSGTETQKAEAITRILNSTYRGFAATAGGPAVIAQRKFANSINDAKEALGNALLPVITNVTTTLSNSLTPVLTKLQEKFADGTSIQAFVTFIGGLLKNLATFAQAIITVVTPVFTEFLIPAFKLAVGAAIGFIKVLGKVGEFISKYSIIFSALVIAIGTYVVVTKLAALATLGVGKAMMFVKKAQQAYAFWTYTTTGAVTGLAGALNLLKTAFLTNPIGIILAAVVGLGFAFKMAWEKSEIFRKVVVGAIQGVLSAVSGGLRFLGKLPGGLGKFFTESANDVDKFSKSLDRMKTITKSAKDVISAPSDGMPDISKLGESTKAAAKTKEQIAAAKKSYEEALKAREGAMAKFKELLSAPFGSPSDITKALSHADATVDSILGMYKDLAEAVEERFKGINQRGKSTIIEFLDRQTKQLIALAGKREFAVEALKKSEEDLKDILQEQANFQKDLSRGIKDFARALINLSDSDTNAILKVTKTGSVLVISQVKKATASIDTIVKQLTDRLTQVVGFGKNIEKLLAAGLNKDYIQQLLEAGPEAASETAQLLTTASAAQIKQINSLYTQINTQATKFGMDMSNVFYSNAVAIAQAFVAGSKAEVDSINAQMTAIKNDIEAVLKPLGDFGGNVGTDMAMKLIAALEAKRALMVATAKSIADDIAAAMAGSSAGPSTSPALAEITQMNKDLEKLINSVSGGSTSKGTTPPIGSAPEFTGPSKYNPFVAPTPAPNIGTPAQRTAFAATQSLNTYGSPVMNARPPVTVNITTNKYTPTVTATTIATAISNQVNYRSR